MRKFYILFKDEIVYAMRAQLSWTHYREMLVLNNRDEIKYYIDISAKQNLTYRELHDRIKSNEYERLDDKTKLKLISEEKLEVNDFVKNPIVIKNNNYEVINEKILKLLIWDHMKP